MMIEEMGEAAGSIWMYLESKGEVSFSKLIDGTGLGKNEANRAIGWLAREGKIGLSKRGRSEMICLN